MIFTGAIIAADAAADAKKGYDPFLARYDHQKGVVPLFRLRQAKRLPGSGLGARNRVIVPSVWRDDATAIVPRHSTGRSALRP
jgi:hypothetical protein